MKTTIAFVFHDGVEEIFVTVGCAVLCHDNFKLLLSFCDMKRIYFLVAAQRLKTEFRSAKRA